jgi:hypothetical protein
MLHNTVTRHVYDTVRREMLHNTVTRHVYDTFWREMLHNTVTRLGAHIKLIRTNGVFWTIPTERPPLVDEI